MVLSRAVSEVGIIRCDFFEKKCIFFLNNMEVKIGRSFKLTKKLGSGAFGEIFHGINLKTNMEVAVKLEPVNTKHP